MEKPKKKDVFFYSKLPITKKNSSVSDKVGIRSNVASANERRTVQTAVQILKSKIIYVIFLSYLLFRYSN